MQDMSCPSWEMTPSHSAWGEAAALFLCRLRSIMQQAARISLCCPYDFHLASGDFECDSDTLHSCRLLPRMYEMCQSAIRRIIKVCAAGLPALSTGNIFL